MTYALLPATTFSITRWWELFSSIVILKGHCYLGSLLLTTVLVCGSWLYMSCFLMLPPECSPTYCLHYFDDRFFWRISWTPFLVLATLFDSTTLTGLNLALKVLHQSVDIAKHISHFFSQSFPVSFSQYFSSLGAATVSIHTRNPICICGFLLIFPYTPSTSG